MLPILTMPSAGGKQPSRARRGRRTLLRPCPRCGQWRSRAQFPDAAVACGACVETLDRRLERAAGAAERRRPLRGDELHAEVEWLLDAGEIPEAICRAVRSPSCDALEQRLYRAGRADLARRVHAAQGRRR